MSEQFEAFPQLDVGTHGGFIVQLQVTPDGRTLVSSGETTLRVWDLEPPADRSASRLKRLLLGRVKGPTDDGAIDGRAERFAISRDGRWVVALKPWRHETCGNPEVGHDGGRVTEVQVFELASGNLLRVLREAEAVARRLRATRPASTATIESLDGAKPRP